MSYKKGNDDISLIDSLNIKGYDVIVVNHIVNPHNDIDGGSDYIERNAFTLISLMRHIKSIQQGNEEAVVIGPSMGGLISRYALAYMEKKYAETGLEKWNHNTRLWVSFDSPHQGANIPIGVQKGIQYFADELENTGAIGFIDNQLSRPATKQMLVNHYTNDTNLPVGAPNFRNRFQNDLDNLGMPQNLRKVALLNGSMSGVLNGISEAQYLQINTRMPIFGSTSPVITNKFYHNTNKKNGSQNYLTFDAGGFYLNFLLFKIYIIAPSEKYSSPSSKGSYDISPGGYFNAQSELANEAKGSSFFTIFGWNYWRTLTTTAYILDQTHSFIPTKSALAYKGSNVLDEVIGNKDRVCAGETPFDSYFAPEDNEEHITLTIENVAWLKAELDVMATDPLPTVYKNFDSSSISGDLAVCDNKTNTYTLDIPNTCSGFNVTWSSSNNIDILYSTNNSVTVRPINGTNDIIGHISAYIQEKDITLDKVVWVGIPSPNFLSINVTNSYNFYANQWTKLKVIHPVPPIELMNNDPTYGLTYQWSVPNSQVRTFTDTSTIDVNPYNTGQLNIGVKMQNQCGCTAYKYELFNVTNQSSGGSGGSNGGGHTLIKMKD
jgi:hypothetical protein